MKKIISAAQTRAADRYTIEHEPIAPIDLMERASQAFVDEFVKFIPDTVVIVVICGPGNNGGDGLAIARLLSDRSYAVSVRLENLESELSPDCQTNWNRLPFSLKADDIDFNSLPDTVIIDALFGSGLNRPVEGCAGELIDKVNKSGAKVVSVDIPSGLYADSALIEGSVIHAALTITFQRPKLSFLLPESGKYVGEWVSLDIGLDEDFIQDQRGDYYLIEESDVAARLPDRPKFAHKGDFGRVQLFSGSIGKMGAALLCANAVLKAGAGLLTSHVPKNGLDIIQKGVPESMATVDEDRDVITSGQLEANTTVCCLGPGIGTSKATVHWLSSFLEQIAVPLILDADALNIIAEQSHLFDLLPEGTIITPHVGEFHRLFGDCANGMERIDKMKSVALAKKIVIVLKGAHTAIAYSSGEVVFNTTGNSGMATAGSGDVLAGIITGLRSQGLSAEEAATCGVYLHGMAGDMVAERIGKMSLMASDLLNELPKAVYNVTAKTFI